MTGISKLIPSGTTQMDKNNLHRKTINKESNLIVKLQAIWATSLAALENNFGT